MALGGGTFVTQNKILPGTYHNFISAAIPTSNLSERGYVALPIVLDWIKDEGVFTVTSEEFQANSLNLFGYSYDSEQLKGLRDVFKNAHTAFIYSVNEGAVAASNTFGTAKCKGIRGNDLKTVIIANVDEPTKFDVSTYLGTTLVDEQTAVAEAKDLVDNDFVIWKDEATLAETAGTNFTGGSNGTDTTATPHQNALDEFETYGFNVLACLTTDENIKSLYVAYTKRMRDEVGAKFQLVGYNLGATDHEGIIDVQNKATELEYGLVYWTAGAEAGCPVNKSNTNKLYDGEYTVDFTGAKTQIQLTNLIKSGKLAFHRVGSDIRILEDINTLTTFTPDKGADFASNQVIRVLDQIAIDTANIFNTRYLGKIPNDQSGRVSLWNDIVSHRLELQGIRAIEAYDKDALVIEQGSIKKSVVMNEVVTPVVAMAQLYITTTVA